MSDKAKVQDKAEEKSADAKVAAQASGEANAGMKDQTQSYKEYVKERKGGMRDKDTQAHLGEQPKFYDSGDAKAQGKQDGKPDTPDVGDKRGDESKRPKDSSDKASDAGYEGPEEYRKDIKQFADDLKDAQKSGDYTEVFENYKKLADAYPNDKRKGGEFSEALNDELHRQGILPSDMNIASAGSLSSLMGGSDKLKGVYVDYTEELTGIRRGTATYDNDGKIVPKGSDLVEGIPTTFNDGIQQGKLRDEQMFVKELDQFIDQKYGEIDKNSNGRITEREIDDYIKTKGDKLDADEKKYLDYLKDNKKEIKGDVNDKGFDFTGMSKDDIKRHKEHIDERAQKELPENNPDVGFDKKRFEEEQKKEAQQKKEAEQKKQIDATPPPGGIINPFDDPNNIKKPESQPADKKPDKKPKKEKGSFIDPFESN